MTFTADKQTLDDLNLMSRFKPDSIYNLFNRVKTTGAERLLEKLFAEPLTDVEEIRKRSETFAWFQRNSIVFPFKRDQLEEVGNYLSDSGGNFIQSAFNLTKLQLQKMTIKDERLDQLKIGLQHTITMLQAFQLLTDRFASEDHPYAARVHTAAQILSDRRLDTLIRSQSVSYLSFSQLVRQDHMIRHVLKKDIEHLLEILYELDVYIAVAAVAVEHRFTQAVALPKEKNLFVAEGLRHPALRNAVGNDLALNKNNNLIFLTGANMAGKSTLMKTFGIAVYLAHMGFPVAATSMAFSVKDGISSSINVSDNLNLGYSHFYAEVLRVKNVAREVSIGTSMYVIFDELFKGTNVKDAFDATLAVITAFADYHRCFFIISTHIIEVAGPLGDACGNTQFKYMPTVMNGAIPAYPYKMESGVTGDRQGMVIIENEGIFQMLNNI